MGKMLKEFTKGEFSNQPANLSFKNKKEPSVVVHMARS
jgi:hypothetical protein